VSILPDFLRQPFVFWRKNMSDSTRKVSLWVAAATTSVLLVVLLVGLPSAPATSGGAALRVHVDPETGEIVPVPVTGLDKAELDRQMKESLNRSSEGLQQVHHPDGRVSMDLQGRYRSLSVATVDSNGQYRAGCVTNAQELDTFMENSGAQHGKQE